MKFQVLYEDPAQGWIPTNLGIFDDRSEAQESAGHWLEGYARLGTGRPRMAIQELRPHPLPEGAALIGETKHEATTPVTEDNITMEIAAHATNELDKAIQHMTRVRDDIESHDITPEGAAREYNRIIAELADALSIA